MNSKSTTAQIFVLTILVLSAALKWYIFYSRTFVALSINDAMDYASIGRNIAEGKGFISSYITPLGLAHKGLPQPDLWRAPVWPAVLALFIKVFGAIDQAVAIASGFFYVAALPLIFLLARYWFGHAVAVGTSVIYMFSAQNLRFSISGLTEPMALFMMAAVAVLLYLPRFRSAGGDVLLGITTGLFYLGRYNALIFLPVILVCRVLLKRADTVTARENAFYGIAATSLRFLSACFITALPWLWRNYILMGSPLFSLQKYEPVMFTKTYPGYSLYTMFQKVNVADFISSHQDEMWIKIAENWHDFTTHLFDPVFTGVSGVLFGFFLASLFLPFNEKQKWFRPFLAACFGLQLAALMVIHYIPRLFFMFMPFYAMYGLAAGLYLFQKICRRQNIALAGVLVLAVVFMLFNQPDWTKPNIKEPLARGYSESLKKAVLLSNKDQLILSNDGHLLAWYGDRYASKLPYSTDMLTDLTGLAPVKLIYLSGRMSWNMPEADDSWRRVFWGKPQELYNFRLLQKFDDGSVIYVKK